MGSIHTIKFHRHPKTKTFLGAATVSFLHSGNGRKAVGELDGKVMGGCYLRAELDDNGKLMYATRRIGSIIGGCSEGVVTSKSL